MWVFVPYINTFLCLRVIRFTSLRENPHPFLCYPFDTAPSNTITLLHSHTTTRRLDRWTKILTLQHGASSPAHMATVHRTMQISRPPSSGRASPYVHGPPILIHGYGAPTPTSVSVLGTPATSNSGAKLPLAYHTPISPVIKGHLPPHMAAMLPSKATASSSSETRGRKRAATVSGNGSADERAHPTASVHLQQSPPEQRRYEVSPSPPPRLSSEKQRSPPSETTQLRRPSGARRSTVSGASPFLPPKEEFIEHAEWLYGVLSRTERLLQELDLQKNHQSRHEA